VDVHLAAAVSPDRLLDALANLASSVAHQPEKM